ncbi:hypothetical protein [Microcystis phage Mwe-JY13]
MEGMMQITDEMVEAGWRGLDKFGRLYVSKAEVGQILTAVLSASPAGVVKPLEWVDRGETIEDRFKASSVVGDYYVRREKSGLFSWRLPALRGSVVVGDAEAAKSAAFADYSARISSAIEPAGAKTDRQQDIEDIYKLAGMVGATFKPYEPAGVGVETRAETLARQIWGYFKGDSTGGTTAMQWFDNHKHMGGPAHIISLCRAALKGDEQ